MNFQQHRHLMESANLKERTEWCVLVSLVFHADAQSAQSFPGRKLMAQESRMTVRCVEQTLEKLIARGFISLVSGGGGKAKKTTYLLHIEQGLPAKETIDRANPIRPISEENSEPDSPYSPYSEPYTANPTTNKDGYTANATQNDISIQRTPRQPYKEEVINKRNEEFYIEECFTTAPEIADTKNENSDFPEKPIVQGIEDSRFRHPHFLAVCKACDLDLKTVSFTTRGKALLAASVLFKAKYSTEQIAAAREAWPYETAPTPQQLQDQIKALLARKEKQNAKPESSQRAEEGRRLRTLAYANSGD